jgi:RND family efflux transporter MFP subunit
MSGEKDMPFAKENHESKNRAGEFLTYCYDKLSRHKFLWAGAVLLLCAVFFLAGSWYGKARGAGNAGPGGRKILHYVDPMNPAHTSPEPGLAPCGMKLEPVYADDTGEGAAEAMPPGTVKISPQKQQLIGVRVAPVENGSYTHSLRALGKVAIDETLIYRLNAVLDGWIKETYNNSTGSVVKKDETLATFYSPEFLGAQQAYMYALSALDRFQATGKETPEQIQLTRRNIQQYADSLRNLGMGELQIKEMERTRQVAENIFISAPATSFILARNLSPGQRFNAGTEWYRLADLSRVWVLADLYENELQYIRPGEKVRVTYPYQKKTFQATVSRVLPIFDPATRTLKVRLELDNPDYLLRPDMFVDVEFPVKLPPTVNVPVDAVLDSGLKKTVFVARGQGFFEPRQVEAGWRLGDRVSILKGLSPGEQIVVSSNFLIDSESRMKLAASGMHGSVGQDPVCGINVDESKASVSGLTAEQGGKTYYFCSDRCKEKFVKEPAGFLGRETVIPEEPSLAAATEKTAAPGDMMAKDPICGMEVDGAKAGQAGRQSEYQGKTNYFCSDNCKQKFDQNPGAYLGKEAKSQTGGDPCCGQQPHPAVSPAPQEPVVHHDPPGLATSSLAAEPGPSVPAAPGGLPAGQPPAMGITGGQTPSAPALPGQDRDIRDRPIRVVPNQPIGIPPAPSQPIQAGTGVPEAGQAQASPMAGGKGAAPMPLVKAEEIPVGLIMPPRSAHG